MPSSFVSPGVYFREVDLSNYVPSLSDTRVAMVITATKGPLNVRTFISTEQQFVLTFGTPNSNHLGMYAALAYLKRGRQLWVVRVEGLASAAATAVTGNMDYLDGTHFTLQAKDPGSYYNGLKAEWVYASPLNVLDTQVGNNILTQFQHTFGGPLVPKSIKVVADTITGVDNGSGVISGTGINGTVNYKTGVVSVTFDDAPDSLVQVTMTGYQYSTFTLVLSRTVNGRVFPLETWRNMTLTGGLSHTYSTILAQSQLVAVPTLTKFPDNTVTGTLGSGTDGIASIVPADYVGANTGFTQTGLQLFSSADQVDLNVIACPGQSDEDVRGALIEIAEERRDCIAVVDPPVGLFPQDAVDWANGNNAYATLDSLNSSYAATYYPWLIINDNYNAGVEVTVPPSGYVCAAYALTDQTRANWYAPMGVVLGKLQGVKSVERILSQGERDLLYENRINSIADFVAQGITIWGQKTTQVAPTALDRVGTRRGLIAVEKQTVTASMPFVSEPINDVLYARVRNTLQPFYNAKRAEGQFYQAVVVCDGNINLPNTIANNTLLINILLDPTKYAERITISFVLLPTGANVNEFIGQVFA